MPQPLFYPLALLGVQVLLLGVPGLALAVRRLRERQKASSLRRD